jgi:glycosyltransferase involved in cell wall biosynthesis
MILVVEMTWTGTHHAPGNSATIQAVASAFPGQAVRVFADPSHLDELRRDAALVALANVDLRPIKVSPLFRGKTHVVSFRRFRTEFDTLRAALRAAPAGEPCLLFLISATPTAIAAASLAARLTSRRVGIQVGLHGNLNEINGWRPRNPLTRRFDLASAVAAPRPAAFRFLVLEAAIRDALARIAPEASRRTDVLPLPVNVAEMPATATARLDRPLRVGFVGQATAAKGFDMFLATARAVKAQHGDAVSFHLVGRAMPGSEPIPVGLFAEEPETTHLSRGEFVRRLAALHYVLLPFRTGYYDLSASGALIDAITWLKPVIATDVPLARHFFETYGSIGFLCDGPEGLTGAVEAVLSRPDQHRYDAEIATLSRARAAREPAALARAYRGIVEQGYPGLLEAPPRAAA